MGLSSSIKQRFPRKPPPPIPNSQQTYAGVVEQTKAVVVVGTSAFTVVVKITAGPTPPIG